MSAGGTAVAQLARLTIGESGDRAGGWTGGRTTQVVSAVAGTLALGYLAYRGVARASDTGGLRRFRPWARRRDAEGALATTATHPSAERADADAVTDENRSDPGQGRRVPRWLRARAADPDAGHPRRRLARRAAWVTFGGAVAVQVMFALLGDSIPLTVASVMLMTATATLHAGSVGGWRFSLGMLSIVAFLTWAAEAIGIATGFPFGEYAYTGSLGPELAGVSVLVLFAWLTLAYPSYVVASRLIGPGGGLRRVARVGLAGFALTAWDVFLDSQMVDAGNWGWANPEPSLPGTPGIPLTNYGGWLLTALCIAFVLDAWHGRARRRGDARELGDPRQQRADAVPYAVYLWTFASCVLGNLTFWARPSVALAGGLVMGTVAIPLVAALIRGRRSNREGFSGDREGFLDDREGFLGDAERLSGRHADRAQRLGRS